MRALGLLLLMIVAASHFVAGAAYAQLPTGSHAISGVTGITTVGNTMTVTTNANRSIVNWQTFSIGSGASVNVLQPGPSSAVLNRVVGGPIDPLVIKGLLQSNGRVFLMKSGIVFAAKAQIDVAGLVVSSLNLSHVESLGRGLRFPGMPRSVLNQGAINAAADTEIYLAGPAATNGAITTTPEGEVMLAAGNSVELVNAGAPNVRVEISAPDNEALDLGHIIASSGRMGIFAGLARSGRALHADRAVVGAAGEILLKGTPTASPLPLFSMLE